MSENDKANKVQEFQSTLKEFAMIFATILGLYWLIFSNLVALRVALRALLF